MLPNSSSQAEVTLVKPIMDICKTWLKGHCKDHKRGTCDLIHIKNFCQDGRNCKDKSCFEGDQKRHVMKCSQRKRWKNGEHCKFPSRWKSCSYYHPELAKIKNKDCKKCDKNQIELEKLKTTVETMRNGSSSNSINVVSSESTFEQCMESRIAKLEKENGELAGQVEILKTSKEKLEGEVKSVRKGLDNWKIKTDNNSKEIENNVDKKISDKIDALGEASKKLNDDAQSIKVSIKQMVLDELSDELFKLDGPGRRCVQEVVKKSEESIVYNLDNYVGIEFEEEDTLKEVLMKYIEATLGKLKDDLTEGLSKEKLGIENLIEEVEHLEGIVNNKIEAAVSKMKDDLTEEFENQIKDKSADTEKIGDIANSVSSLENDVTGLKTGFTNIGTKFTNLKQNLRANIMDELKKMGSDASIVDEKIKKEILAEVTDKFLDAAVDDLCSELKSNWQKVQRDLETLGEEKNRNNKFTNLDRVTINSI